MNTCIEDATFQRLEQVAHVYFSPAERASVGASVSELRNFTRYPGAIATAKSSLGPKVIAAVKEEFGFEPPDRLLLLFVSLLRGEGWASEQ